MDARALVLDSVHRVLLVPARDGEGWELPRTEVRPDERAMVAIERAVSERFGLAVSDPCGARPLDAEPLDFVYLARGTSPGLASAESPRWVPMGATGAQSPRDDAAIWSLYTDAMLGGYRPPSREIDVFFFGDDVETAARLAHLVVKGTKRATAGWIDAEKKKGSVIPWPGLVSVVTDGFGLPLCCIESERVHHLRFREVGEDLASAEGEGDRSLDYWREVHRRAFSRQAAALDLPFSDDAAVFVECFRVLKVFSRADEPSRR